LYSTLRRFDGSTEAGLGSLDVGRKPQSGQWGLFSGGNALLTEIFSRIEKLKGDMLQGPATCDDSGDLS
jgi:hypothetical protein